jgi:hypothetical protein
MGRHLLLKARTLLLVLLVLMLVAMALAVVRNRAHESLQRNEGCERVWCFSRDRLIVMKDLCEDTVAVSLLAILHMNYQREKQAVE